MVADLMLVCHGPTRATRTGAFPVDEPLEPGCLDRLPRAVLRLQRFGLAWTSPALRARETAEAIGLEAETDLGLSDWDFGRWAGCTLDHVSQHEPEGLAAWLGDPAAAPHGGEPLIHLLDRVAGWLDAKREVSARRVAVTHASIIRAAVVGVLGGPATAFWRIDIEPFAIVRLRSDGRRWMLRATASRDSDDG